MPNNTPKIRPLSDRILVEPKSAETKTQGGIVLPDSMDKEKPVEGTVLAVGNGKHVDGKLRPLDIAVGDRILYGKYSGTNIKLEGKEYLVMREEDVMGVLEN